MIDELDTTDRCADLQIDRPISLIEMPKILRELTGSRVSYQMIYHKVVAGDLPATRTPTGRWVVARRDLPLYAAALCDPK